MHVVFFAAPVAGPQLWSAVVATSGDGSMVFGAISAQTETNGATVFYSYDHAKTWTAAAGSSQFALWLYMAASASGQYVVGVDNTNVYLSTNFGVSYAQTYAEGVGGIFLTGITLDSTGECFIVLIFVGVLTAVDFQASTPLSRRRTASGSLRSTEWRVLGPPPTRRSATRTARTSTTATSPPTPTATRSTP